MYGKDGVSDDGGVREVRPVPSDRVLVTSWSEMSHVVVESNIGKEGEREKEVGKKSGFVLFVVV